MAGGQIRLFKLLKALISVLLLMFCLHYLKNMYFLYVFQIFISVFVKTLTTQRAVNYILTSWKIRGEGSALLLSAYSKGFVFFCFRLGWSATVKNKEKRRKNNRNKKTKSRKVNTFKGHYLKICTTLGLLLT